MIYVHFSFRNQVFSASVCLSYDNPEGKPVVSNELEAFCEQLAEKLRIVSATASSLPVEETALTSHPTSWKVAMYLDHANPILVAHQRPIRGVITEFVANQGSPQAQPQAA